MTRERNCIPAKEISTDDGFLQVPAGEWLTIKKPQLFSVRLMEGEKPEGWRPVPLPSDGHFQIGLPEGEWVLLLVPSFPWRYTVSLRP